MKSNSTIFKKNLTLEDLLELSKKQTPDKIKHLLEKQDARTLHELNRASVSKMHFELTLVADKYVLPIVEQFKISKVLIKAALLSLMRNSVNSQDKTEFTAEDYGITPECFNQIQLAVIKFKPEYVEYEKLFHAIENISKLIVQVQRERTQRADDNWSEEQRKYRPS